MIEIAVAKRIRVAFMWVHISEGYPINMSSFPMTVPLIALLATAGCQGRSAQYGQPYYSPQPQQAVCYHPEPPSDAEAQMAMMAATGTNPNAIWMLHSYQLQRENREKACR